MAKKKLAVLLLTLVALAGACGGSRSATAGGHDSTTSTTSAIDFAKQYVDVCAQFDQRGSVANAELQAAGRSQNIASIIEALHAVGEINWELSTALLAQKWPDDVTPAIQKQAKILGDLSNWQRIVTASDWTSAVEAIQHIGAEYVAATQATRELLGLPPADGATLPA